MRYEHVEVMTVVVKFGGVSNGNHDEIHEYVKIRW